MSTNKGFLGWGTDDTPGDERLLRYLYRNRHTTPFEMAGATFEVQAPLFVLRQWHRHRTQSYNELSGRYVPMPDGDYFPDAAWLTPRPSQNKQKRGTSDRVPTNDEIDNWLRDLKDLFDLAQAVYQQGLDIGIPKERARIAVPVARFTRMRASANLLNWMRFLGLRADSHAQNEIRVYAHALADCLRNHFPRTMDLFDKDPL